MTAPRDKQDHREADALERDAWKLNHPGRYSVRAMEINAGLGEGPDEEIKALRARLDAQTAQMRRLEAENEELRCSFCFRSIP